MVDVPVPDLYAHLSADFVFPAGIAVGQLAAHHALDDAVLVNVPLGVVDGLDGSAVPDHGDLIRHIGDLVEFVGDDDGRHPLLLELQKQIQQHPGVLLVQG